MNISMGIDKTIYIYSANGRVGCIFNMGYDRKN